MHQHTSVSYIIGMVVFDLEVINLYRAFKKFVLDFLSDRIFPVDADNDITGTEMCGIMTDNATASICPRGIPGAYRLAS